VQFQVERRCGQRVDYKVEDAHQRCGAGREHTRSTVLSMRTQGCGDLVDKTLGPGSTRVEHEAVGAACDFAFNHYASHARLQHHVTLSA
jgi:hypothetical protein